MIEATEPGPSISQRISELSPQKRELIERLLEEEGLQLQLESSAVQSETPPSVCPRAVTDSQDDVTNWDNFEVDRFQSSRSQDAFDEVIDKDKIREFYDSVSDQLNSRIAARHSMFLNWGYIANDNERHSPIELPAYCLNKNFIRLILEVIGDCDIRGRRILDVGCGRGGAIDVMNSYFHPQETIGLDLASGAIRFCKEHCRHINVSFVEGDAERMPFRDESFDVITNIESSHLYPNICSFYMEVSDY